MARQLCEGRFVTRTRTRARNPEQARRRPVKRPSAAPRADSITEPRKEGEPKRHPRVGLGDETRVTTSPTTRTAGPGSATRSPATARPIRAHLGLDLRPVGDVPLEKRSSRPCALGHVRRGHPPRRLPALRQRTARPRHRARTPGKRVRVGRWPVATISNAQARPSFFAVLAQMHHSAQPAGHP